ncbi:hypothetical protein RhiJN_17672 [Ceratobasidium sp. AG-Ba]|nr:hypothetical protein RhiJN_17672 [Ceratobasidium sp. AG-Ba]
MSRRAKSHLKLLPKRPSATTQQFFSAPNVHPRKRCRMEEDIKYDGLSASPVRVRSGQSTDALDTTYISQAMEQLHIASKDTPTTNSNTWQGDSVISQSTDSQPNHSETEDRPSTSMGQNEMLSRWKKYSSQYFLNAILASETPGNSGVECIYKVDMRFCRHKDHSSDARQLLDAQIFPCSDERPASGFTFSLMRLAHILHVEAKISSERLYHVLVHRSNPINPSVVPDRYREFMRCLREWQYLQDLKRAGVFDARTSSKEDGDLSIACPACPRLRINIQKEDIIDTESYVFGFHISYDGSFQLYRKNKVYDKWDICLTDGRKYFVEGEPYKRFLQSTSNARVTATTRDAGCNNHKAASDAWPLGTVDYYTGERYAYADYALNSVIGPKREEGITEIGVYYDVMCHYFVNMWERWLHLQQLSRPVTEDDFWRFIAAVPKFHLAGHTKPCFARFSLNFIAGVGRIDAKGGERCWAILNHAAGSICEKGPGARKEAIQNVMGQMNWVKLIALPSHTAELWREAVKQAAEHESAFREFSSSIPDSLLSEWLNRDTAPYMRNGKWTSVFIHNQEDGTCYHSVLQYAEEHPTPDLSEFPRVGAASWIQDGINIMFSQHCIKQDISHWGKSLSNSHEKELQKR